LKKTAVAEPYTRSKYIPALDGIRFLAVALVILHHLTRGSQTSFVLHLIGMQTGNGLGPTLFFVLSGVLLTTVILDARGTEHRYRNFLTRRALRIFPLYLAYFGAAAIVTYLFAGRNLQNAWVYAFFLQNTFTTAAAQTGSVLPVYHLWTLAVQDQFYIFWPLLLWRCDSVRKMRYLCLAGIILSFVARLIITNPSLTPELLGRSLPARAGEMCLGALLALDVRERTALSGILRKALLPLSLVLAVWMWHGLSLDSSLGSTLGLQLMAVTSAAWIACALQPSTWTARILGSKFPSLGGKKYAFAMYIFHPMVLNISMALPIASKGLRLAVFGITTIVVSGLSYRYYESFFLHMKLGVGGSKAPRHRPSFQTRTMPALSQNSFQVSSVSRSVDHPAA
jgi:peptidoglycan/LPS O-acetylase OafA/YrhL